MLEKAALIVAAVFLADFGKSFGVNGAGGESPDFMGVTVNDDIG